MRMHKITLVFIKSSVRNQRLFVIKTLYNEDTRCDRIGFVVERQNDVQVNVSVSNYIFKSRGKYTRTKLHDVTIIQNK